jgi:hypothetical protein
MPRVSPSAPMRALLTGPTSRAARRAALTLRAPGQRRSVTAFAGNVSVPQAGRKRRSGGGWRGNFGSGAGRPCHADWGISRAGRPCHGVGPKGVWHSPVDWTVGRTAKLSIWGRIASASFFRPSPFHLVSSALWVQPYLRTHPGHDRETLPLHFTCSPPGPR